VSDVKKHHSQIRSHSSVRLAVAAAIAGAHCNGLLAADLDSTQAFSIPAQPLSAALFAYSEQASIQVMATTADLADITTQGVSGKQTAREALEALLRGTGLKFKVVSAAAVTLEPSKGRDRGRADSSSTGMLQEPGVLRLAQAGSEAGTATAGAADARADDVGEIIVTAQKVAQSVTDVPISMSVLGEADLEAMRVQGAEDYVQSIPNATYSKHSPRRMNLTLRGVSKATGGAYDPIGVTIDDAGFGVTSNQSILTARFLDIERVEVLRGPQGTMTGRNSMSGTLNIISAKPDTSGFSGKATLDLSKFDTGLGKLVLNTPLSDTLAVRTVGFYEHSDGAVRDTGSGASSGFNHAGGRMAVRWMPTDRLTIDAAFGYEKLRYGMTSYLPVDTFLSTGPNRGEVSFDRRESTEMTNRIGSFRASYAFDAHAVDLLYGHYSHHMQAIEDRDKSIIADRDIDRRLTVPSDSAEIRFSSRYTGPVNWVAGVSYLSEKRTQLQIGRDGDQLSFGEYFPPESYYTARRKLESRSAFANVFWDFADRWHLSVGARVSEDETGDEPGVTYPPGDPVPPVETRSAKLTEVSPRVAVNFDLTDDVTTYAQFATGYRAGFGTDPRGVELGLIGPEVDAEKIKNYEVGLKGSFLDGRVDAAAALFYMDWQDLQVADYIYQDGSYIYLDYNAGEAYAKGFELEAGIDVTEALEVRAAVGYVDSSIKELPRLSSGEVAYDVDVPEARPWTTALSAIYSRPVRGDWRGTLRADYRWQDKTYQTIQQGPDNLLMDYDSLSLSAGLSSGRWDVTAYMENVTNQKYWLQITEYNNREGTLAVFEPRTFGLRVNYKFK
jgi:iron complex outermembrane receptor protein